MNHAYLLGIWLDGGIADCQHQLEEPVSEETDWAAAAAAAAAEAAGSPLDEHSRCHGGQDDAR